MSDVITNVDRMKAVYNKFDPQLDTIEKLAAEKLQMERDFEVANMQMLFMLREQKVPTSIINAVCKGKMADQKFQLEVKTAEYQAAIRKLKVLETKATLLQSINRWQGD